MPNFPQMVSISPGAFFMGADDEGDKFASVVEKPRHLVKIEKPFAISKFPTTFAEFDLFCEANPSVNRPCDRGWGRGNFPVINVSWNDATEYVKWLARETGKPFRLPSEAEWEFCCRAGGDSLFSTGATIDVTQANFLYTDLREKPGVGKSLPVGSFPPNAFGLFDMHGNVCELVADVWHDSYRDAPADGSPQNQPSESAWRVVRGGGWDALPRVLRSAFRDWVRVDQRLDNMGFRIACDL